MGPRTGRVHQWIHAPETIQRPVFGKFVVHRLLWRHSYHQARPCWSTPVAYGEDGTESDDAMWAWEDRGLFSADIPQCRMCHFFFHCFIPGS